MLHNYEDLYYLLDVINIIEILNQKKSFTIEYNNHNNYFLINEIILNKDYLSIRGKIEDNNIINTIHFADNYKIIITKDNIFEVSLEVEEGLVTPTKRCTFIKAMSFDFPNKVYWSDKFTIPKGIVLLSVENVHYMDNIKLIIRGLIDKIIN